MFHMLLDFFEKNEELVSLLLNLVALVVGFLTNKGWERIKKKRAVSALKLDRKKLCKIIVPTYEDVKLHQHGNVTTGFNVNGQGDVLASINIISLIRQIGLKFDEDVFFQEQYNQTLIHNNVFCIGGIVANEQTRSYFSEKFPNFRIYIPKLGESITRNDIYYEAENKRGFRWGDGKEFIAKQGEDYAIIVRLTGEDFGLDNAGTVYILYGNNINATLMASKYFLHHVNDLIKRTKGKEHFFIVMRIPKKAGARYYFDENYDLTEELFAE